MGLDLVELVMETEERFGVHLPDEECAQVRTVADLTALVISKLSTDCSVCPTSRMFYRVRCALAESGVPRSQIRPGTLLSDMRPLARRHVLRKLKHLDGGPRLRVRHRGAKTIADLVRVMTPQPLPSDFSARLLAENQVLDEVRRITSEQLGIPFDRVRPDSDFVKDLGAG